MADNNKGAITPCLIEDFFRLAGYEVEKNGQADQLPIEGNYFVRRLRKITHNKPQDKWATFIYDRRNCDLVDIKVYEIDRNGNKRSQSVGSK